MPSRCFTFILLLKPSVKPLLPPLISRTQPLDLPSNRVRSRRQGGGVLAAARRLSVKGNRGHRGTGLVLRILSTWSLPKFGFPDSKLESGRNHGGKKIETYPGFLARTSVNAVVVELSSKSGDANPLSTRIVDVEA